MAYLRRAIEGAAILGLALVLAGCVGERERLAEKWGPHQWAPDAHQTVPARFDYLRNIRCGAIATLQGDLRDAPSAKGEGYQRRGLFLAWAQIRARETGQNPGKAGADIDALAAGMFAQLGEGGAQEKRDRLATQHKSDIDACFAPLADLEGETVIF